MYQVPVPAFLLSLAGLSHRGGGTAWAGTLSSEEISGPRGPVTAIQLEPAGDSTETRGKYYSSHVVETLGCCWQVHSGDVRLCLIKRRGAHHRPPTTGCQYRSTCVVLTSHCHTNLQLRAKIFLLQPCPAHLRCEMEGCEHSDDSGQHLPDRSTENREHFPNSNRIPGFLLTSPISRFTTQSSFKLSV